jgi:CPA1 family monovalent cation:H+ antiporter
MEGEALFNDGVGVVLFTVLLTFAVGGGGHEAVAVGEALRLLGIEVVGGLGLGLAAGFAAYWAMRSVDDVTIEVLITLALVAGTYAVAQAIGASGPLAVVAAGLLIGDWAPRDAMSEDTKTRVLGFWTLVDEIFNAVLFLLIGLEVVVLRFAPGGLLLAAASVPIVLAARALSIACPFLLFRLFLMVIGSGMLSARNVPFLIWGGVRGGISVALALSLPEDPAKPTILAATYAVVLFSIVVQGSTLGWLARRTLVGGTTMQGSWRWLRCWQALAAAVAERCTMRAR